MVSDRKAIDAQIKKSKVKIQNGASWTRTRRISKLNCSSFVSLNNGSTGVGVGVGIGMITPISFRSGGQERNQVW